MVKNEKILSPANFIAALVIAVLVISASVTFTLFDRAAYTRMLDKTGLPEAIGFSKEEILENYNALIGYNSLFFTGPLVFPTLDMSESGRIHFEEVKEIFSVIQIALIISAAMTAVFCVKLFKKKRIKFLTLGGIISLLIPAAVAGTMLAVGWDRFFVLFHHLFFNNEFWVFDYMTDPVILILPDTWFLKCLFRIITGIVVSSIILVIFSKTFENILKFRK